MIHKLQTLAPRTVSSELEPQDYLDLWKDLEIAEVQRLLVELNEYQSAYTMIRKGRLSSGLASETVRINDYFRQRTNRRKFAGIYLLDELVNPEAVTSISKFIQQHSPTGDVLTAFTRVDPVISLTWDMFKDRPDLLERSACQIRNLLEIRLAKRVSSNDETDLQLKRQIYTFLYTREISSRAVWEQLLNFRLNSRIEISDTVINL